METNNEKKATILIVDDSPDSIALLSSLLKDSYRVKVAITGEKALEIVAGRDRVDLILLDIVMPGMDGYETCGRLKRNPDTAGIPVIFLTSKSEAIDEEKGLALGAEGLYREAAEPCHRGGADQDPAPAQERQGSPRCRHDRHGLARGDAGQRDREPHPPNPELHQDPRRKARRASALRGGSIARDDRASLQIRPAGTTLARSASRIAS